MDFVVKLTLFAAATLAVFYFSWAAMHDIAHGESDPTFEYTALGVALFVVALLCLGAELWLPARLRALWLAVTGLLVLLYDVAAINAVRQPKYPSDPALGTGVLLTGIPLLAWFTVRLLNTHAWGWPWGHRKRPFDELRH